MITDTKGGEMLVAYRFQLNKRTEVRAYVQEYEGALYAHIRRFTRKGTSDELLPKRGIAVPIGQLSELLVAAEQLVAQQQKNQPAPTAAPATRRCGRVGRLRRLYPIRRRWHLELSKDG